MCPNLGGHELEVITDHLTLKRLNSIENSTGRFVRWALQLQQHKFTVKYRKGKWNKVAEALSQKYYWSGMYKHLRHYVKKC